MAVIILFRKGSSPEKKMISLLFHAGSGEIKNSAFVSQAMVMRASILILFYAVSPEKECDLFRCMENGKLYLPCENDLQEYVEAEKCKLPKSTRPKERIE